MALPLPALSKTLNSSPERYFSNIGKGELLKILSLLNSSPAIVTGFLGKLSSSCCCCSHPLKDKTSLKKGYGPTCEKKYGLDKTFGDLNKFSIVIDTEKTFNSPPPHLLNAHTPDLEEESISFRLLSSTPPSKKRAKF